MTRTVFLSCLVALLLVAAARAQDSLCNPCVDPPMNRTLLPEPDDRDTAGVFDLGASISALRDLQPRLHERLLILVDGAATAAADEPGEDSPAPAAEPPASDDSAESSQPVDSSDE